MIFLKFESIYSLIIPYRNNKIISKYLLFTSIKHKSLKTIIHNLVCSLCNTEKKYLKNKTFTKILDSFLIKENAFTK